MSEIRLKPCPFCGRDLSKFPEVMTVLPVHSEEYLISEMQHEKIIGSDKGYAVNCIKCGAVGARGMTKEEAVKKWNTRAVKMTNYEKIKNMTFEEMVGLIRCEGVCNYCIYADDDNCKGLKCQEGVTAWLNQEADND